MPYTVVNKDNPLRKAADFFATSEGKEFFLKEWERLRAYREDETKPKDPNRKVFACVS